MLSGDDEITRLNNDVTTTMNLVVACSNNPCRFAKLYTICCNMIEQYYYFTNPVLSCVVTGLLFLFRRLNYLSLLVCFAVFCSKACDVHPLHVTLFACCSKMPCDKSLINLVLLTSYHTSVFHIYCQDLGLQLRTCSHGKSCPWVEGYPISRVNFYRAFI